MTEATCFKITMTGRSLGLRTGSCGSLQSDACAYGTGPVEIIVSRPSKIHLPSSRDKGRFLALLCRYFTRTKVGMVFLIVCGLMLFSSSFSVVRDAPGSDYSSIAHDLLSTNFNNHSEPQLRMKLYFEDEDHHQTHNDSEPNSVTRIVEKKPQLHHHLLPSHPCKHFAFPPPPPSDRKRIGPRSCPVCYLPVEEAINSMPGSPQTSPVLYNLTYVHEEPPIKTELVGGSNFGGYPTIKQRNESFNIEESMAVHCGFVQGDKPGQRSGFDIDEADLIELEQFHDVIVASAIFGNYDIIQQPTNISEAARENVPFFMFIDEETGVFMRNRSAWNGCKRLGIWRIIVVHNIPYVDARRNGKIPKLLLHRIFPNARYSLWIDGKLQLMVDPYQILERFLWRENATFAISRHYKRFDVFDEAEVNKAAGKYDNSSVDYQIDFYRKEGLTPYSEAKLPISSDVPEGCVIIREHVPITNLFSCLWFNEVDRFTSRDQLSFSTVRDKIMFRVDWRVNMFLDCERRNFVVQAYHRDLLERLGPPAGAIGSLPPPPSRRNPMPLPLAGNGRAPARKKGGRRRRGDRKAGLKERRRSAVGSWS